VEWSDKISDGPETIGKETRMETYPTTILTKGAQDKKKQSLPITGRID
jgi:hypothetical protein